MDMFMNNKEFAKTDKYFKLCCDAADIKPTKREVSRFQYSIGKAYKVGKPIIDKKIKKGSIQFKK